jgi:hypothetical protein
MELDEFISKTLVSIRKGLKSANGELGGAPVYMIEPSSWYKDREDGCIKFDVAVTAVKESETKGTAGIKIWSVGLDGKKGTNTTDQVVSRIKFNIAPNNAIS